MKTKNSVYMNGLILIISLSSLFFISCKEQSPANKKKVAPKIIQALQEYNQKMEDGKTFDIKLSQQYFGNNNCFTQRCTGMPCIEDYKNRKDVEIYDIIFQSAYCECRYYQLYLFDIPTYKKNYDTQNIDTFRQWQGYFLGYSWCRKHIDNLSSIGQYKANMLYNCSDTSGKGMVKFIAPRPLSNAQINQLKTGLTTLNKEPFFRGRISPSTWNVRLLKQGKFDVWAGSGDATHKNKLYIDNLRPFFYQVLADMPLLDTCFLRFLNQPKNSHLVYCCQ